MPLKSRKPPQQRGTKFLILFATSSLQSRVIVIFELLQRGSNSSLKCVLTLLHHTANLKS